MGLSTLTRVAMEIPRGEDGFWKIIRALDARGPWAINDVVGKTNVQPGTVSAYCKRLRLGGYIKEAGDRPHPRPQFGPTALYRIAKPVILPPRLNADGSERPEPAIERIWRAMKMSKSFTARELLSHLELEEAPPALNTIRSYLAELATTGLVIRTDGGRNGGKRGGGTVEARFRLVRNIGPQAPKILAGKIVFDPNAEKVLGSRATGEVSA